MALCLFFLLLNLHQSGPPGQILPAGNPITADTILAEPGWNFSEDTERTPSYPAKVKQLHRYVLKPKHVKSREAADSLIQVYAGLCAAAVSWAGLPLVTLDLIPGLQPAAAHSTHRPLK